MQYSGYPPHFAHDFVRIIKIPVKQIIIYVWASRSERHIITAVKQQPPPHIQVSHGKRRSHPDMQIHASMVVGPFGLRRAKHPIHKTVHQVWAMKRLHDQVMLPAPHPAQFVTSLINHLTFPGCETFGQGLHERLQPAVIRMEHQCPVRKHIGNLSPE